MAQAAGASTNDLTKLDIARIRVRLLAIREELEARRSERDLLQLKQIGAALQKMSRGGYGTCESCFRPVLRTRLLEAPYVRYCANCSGERSVPRQPRDAGAAAR
jgi:RNA polymerase-binding transcription factor DksA